VAERSGHDVLLGERLPEQWVVVQIILSGREIIRRALEASIRLSTSGECGARVSAKVGDSGPMASIREADSAVPALAQAARTVFHFPPTVAGW
jgi:hypothetical protein